MANGMTPYGVSFIQTAAGAMITGEIKRYNTYKDMVTDPAPTRLASVSNASRDEDYPVDDDHKGGILFQRDFINSTWIKIYSDEDLALPTYIDWSHILNVPLWVGGVSNNRVKLNTHTYAVPRTTYYSYGPYRLILPPAEEVKLGEEIILEQYDNYGIVLYYIDPDRVPKPAYAQTKTDDSTGKTYCYIYTSPLYRFNLDGSGNVIYSTDGTPIASRTYRFIRTETDSGYPTWMLCLDQGDIDRVISELKKNEVKHSRALDPHPVYVRKDEVARYLTTNVVSASHELNDAGIDIIPGTEEIEGTVYLSVYNKDFGTNSDPNRPGNVVATVKDIRRYLTANYALANHPHEYTDIRNVPLAKILDYTINGNVDYIHIVTTKLLADSLNGYALANHSHDIEDVDQLQENLDDINNRFDTKADIAHEHYLSDIVDYQDLILRYNVMADNRSISPGYSLQQVSSLQGRYLAQEWGVVDIAANLGENVYSILDFKVKFETIFHVSFNVIYLDTTVESDANHPAHKDAVPQLYDYQTKDPTTSLYRTWTSGDTSGITGMRYVWNKMNSEYQSSGAKLIWKVTGIGNINNDNVVSIDAFTIMYGFDRIGANLTEKNYLKTGSNRIVNLNRIEGINLDEILTVHALRTRSFSYSKKNGYTAESDSTAVGRNGTLMLYGDVTNNPNFDPITGSKYPYDIGITNVTFDAETFYISPFWAVYGKSTIVRNDIDADEAGYITNGNVRDNCLYIPSKYVKIEKNDTDALITIFLNEHASLFIYYGDEAPASASHYEKVVPICSDYANSSDFYITSKHLSANTIVYDTKVHKLMPHWAPLVIENDVSSKLVRWHNTAKEWRLKSNPNDTLGALPVDLNRGFSINYWLYPSDTKDSNGNVTYARCKVNNTSDTSLTWQMHGLIEGNDITNATHLNATITHYNNYTFTAGDSAATSHSYRRKIGANGLPLEVFITNRSGETERYYVWEQVDNPNNPLANVYSKVRFPVNKTAVTMNGIVRSSAADVVYYNPYSDGDHTTTFSSFTTVLSTNSTTSKGDNTTKPFVGSVVRAPLNSEYELTIFMGEFVQISEKAGVKLLFPFNMPSAIINNSRKIDFDITQMDYCVSREATEDNVNPFKYRLYVDSVASDGLGIISMEKCDFGTGAPHPAAYSWMCAFISERN